MESKKLLSAKFLIPAALCLVAICGITVFYFFASMSSSDRDAKIFVDADDDIDSLLVKVEPYTTSTGRSGFSILINHLGNENMVKPGMYLLKPGTSAFSFFRKLRNGQQDFLMVAIPTARTTPELAKKLDGKLLADSAAYMKVFSDSVKIAKYGFNKETITAMFIPETYDFFWTDTPDKILDRMHKEYEKFWTDERKAKAQALGLTPLEVSALASIVDGETNIDADKPVVAGVYLNRLKIGMKLQADPTVKFAYGDFTLRRILNKHLAVDSPYNTYKYAGLPPGPISIPTISALEATLNPKQHEYIYFCASPKFDGTHIFAKTWEEHLANARNYQAALNERNIK